MPHEFDQAKGERIRCGLGSGDENGHQGSEDLVGLEPAVGLVLGLEHVGHQIVPGMRALLLH